MGVGFGFGGRRSNWSLTGFLDDVSDFILRDRAHGQEGILRDDGAFIYRNVEARLVGLELEGRAGLGEHVAISGTASGVRGDNRTDDRVLAQIPPLQGRVGLDWDASWGGLGAGLRWAARQTRVDDDPRTGSGLDPGETPGYAVLDLSGTYEIGRGISLAAGVDNLFDHVYADHLSRSNLFDPEPVRVNEPGRSFWVRLGWHGGADL